MPCPRRSKATSRNCAASELSYWRAQHRWFCDQPWTNRIGRPDGSPHSRTCSRRPPPPGTVWICVRSATVDICVLLDRVGRDPRRGGAPPHRARGLILSRAAPYFGARRAYLRTMPLVGRDRELDALE